MREDSLLDRIAGRLNVKPEQVELILIGLVEERLSNRRMLDLKTRLDRKREMDEAARAAAKAAQPQAAQRGSKR